MNLKTLGSNIRKFRVAAGYSQVKLAARTGTTNSYIYELEKGDAQPKVFLAHKIATTLGVTVEQLLEEHSA